LHGDALGGIGRRFGRRDDLLDVTERFTVDARLAFTLVVDIGDVIAGAAVGDGVAATVRLRWNVSLPSPP